MIGNETKDRSPKLNNCFVRGKKQQRQHIALDLHTVEM